MWMFVSNSSINQNDGFHIDYSSLSVACSRHSYYVLITSLTSDEDGLPYEPATQSWSQITHNYCVNERITILVEFVHLAYKIGFHPVFSMPILFVVKRNGKTSSDHLIGLTLTFCLWCGRDSDELPGRLFPWFYVTQLWFYHNSLWSAIAKTVFFVSS